MREIMQCRYWRMEIFLITGGVSGLLIPPSSPMVIGVRAKASTTVIPDVTHAKFT